MSVAITEQWQSREIIALAGGGQNRVEKQIASGKGTARSRLDLLLDSGSFHEIDRLATSPFLTNKEFTDGVVAGFGKINNVTVAIYSQDFTIKGGSLGKRHAEKICKIMDMAVKIGCPIIALLDSGGARIDEGIHALDGYSKIFMRNSRYSGVVPQIAVLLGPCAGGAVYSPALTDFIFMTETISQMFITGPQVIEQVLFQKITKEELGGSDVHARKSGVAHVVAQTEAECLDKVKTLLTYLPNNYLGTPAYAQVSMVDTNEGDLEKLVPENFNQSYDIKKVIAAISDPESFFEIQAAFAANIVIGFAHLEGHVIGIVANQPLVKAGCIDIDASCKAARFILFCDSFGIPIISLVDVPGYQPGIDQEHNGIIKHGAKLLYAYATATVPKITVILRKAYGGAYIVMGSKSLGADFNFAWPQAQIAVLGAKAGVAILHGRQLAQEPEHSRTDLQQALETDYSQEFLNPFIAAEHGYLDAIITPNDTRKQLIQALEITRNKVEQLPKKKHGNIPL
jgi:acetyl-CoA carboxylase carboxyltransferase component